MQVQILLNIPLRLLVVKPCTKHVSLILKLILISTLLLLRFGQ